MWVPSTEVVARELGGDPGRDRRLLYRLCGRCANRCQAGDREFVATVEAAVLRLWRTGAVHRVVDGVAAV